MDLSIVSPCYNESDNLEELIERNEKAVKEISLAIAHKHIIIDNTLSDKSLEILTQVKLKFPKVRVLHNSENIGVFLAFRGQFGCQKATGRYLFLFQVCMIRQK